MRMWAGLAVGVSLSGCVNEFGPPSLAALGQAIAPGQGQGIRQFGVYRGAVNIVGPRGYCIDELASRSRSGFAMLTSCVEISDARDAPAIEALISVQVGEDGSAGVAGQETELVALFESDAGREMLSRSGSVGDVAVTSTQGSDGAVFLGVHDRTPSPLGPVEPDYWRVFFDLNDRIVALTVLSRVASPISEADALRLLREMRLRLEAANEG